MVFETLRDFTRYPAYSAYLETVLGEGQSGPGTEYELRFQLFGTSFDVRTRLVDLRPPQTIEWEVIDELDARGRWNVSELDGGKSSRIELEIEYDPQSVSPGTVSLPFGVSLGWVQKRAERVAQSEARQILDRIATELESPGEGSDSLS